MINRKGWSLLFYPLCRKEQTDAKKKSIPELRESIEKVEKQKEIHERELKIMQHQIKKLTRQERTHRLIQRGAILEKFLIDPGALSEDQVMELVALAFSKPDIQVKLKKMISENNVTA